MSNHESQEVRESFISLFIEHYKSYESPTSFWKWAAYSTIGAILKSNVWFQHGNFKIYPNTYVIFLADSAQYRKGQPIEVSRRLTGLLKHTKIFSGTASIQAVLDLLSQTLPASKNSGIPLKGGSALITADELASFFVQDPRLIPLLTDMWTPRVGENNVFEYNLRSSDSIIVKDLCVSLLAASNETFLREVYDSRAVYGGLLGRTFMIKPDETRPPNSLMEEETVYDEKHLVDSLYKIKALQGRITIQKDAAQSYTAWYKDLYAKYKTHPDRTGVIQRMHTNVIKLAIILAASEYTTEVTKQIFEKAILEVTSLKQNYELYIMSAGKSNLSEIGAKLLAAMAQNDNKILRKDFLMKNWSEVTAEDFDKLVETLKQGGMIKDYVDRALEIGYEMTPRCIAVMNKDQK